MLGENSIFCGGDPPERRNMESLLSFAIPCKSLRKACKILALPHARQPMLKPCSKNDITLGKKTFSLGNKKPALGGLLMGRELGP